jgi:hypothetical protein
MVQAIFLKTWQSLSFPTIAYFLHGTRKFITVLTKARHQTLSWSLRCVSWLIILGYAVQGPYMTSCVDGIYEIPVPTIKLLFSVSIVATRWTPGSITDRDVDFSLHDRFRAESGAHRASCPIGTRDSFPGGGGGIKGPGREADHSPPSSAEVKYAWSYTSIPPVHLHRVMLC